MNTVVDKLALGGKLNSIFEDTVFSIYSIIWNSGQSQSSGIDINRSKWLAASLIEGSTIEGYKWALTQNVNTHMKGVGTSTEGTIAFGPDNANPNSLLASWMYRNDLIMVDYTHDSLLSTSQWKIEYVGIDHDLLLFNIGIANAVTPLKNGTVATFSPGTGFSTVAISIVTPGSKLLSEYCKNINNISTPICANWCASNALKCEENRVLYCSDENNTGSEFCTRYCYQKNSNCDGFLKPWCGKRLQEFGNDVSQLLQSDFSDSCACFLPDSTMKGYVESLSSTFKVNIDKGASKCYFPECSQSKTSTKPFRWKHECDNCPKDSRCVKSVDIDFQGKINGTPDIAHVAECVDFGVVKPFNDFSSPPPNACTANKEGKKIIKKSPKSGNHLIFGLIVFGGVIIISVGAYKIVQKIKSS